MRSEQNPLTGEYVFRFSRAELEDADAWHSGHVILQVGRMCFAKGQRAVLWHIAIGAALASEIIGRGDAVSAFMAITRAAVSDGAIEALVALGDPDAQRIDQILGWKAAD
jgi:hypothetical protein